MTLTTEQIHQYRAEGYLVFPALICGEPLAFYKGVLDELVDHARSLSEGADGYSLQPDTDGSPIAGRLFKVQGVCCVDERMLGLARELAIAERVGDLIGPQLHMFSSKFFPMLPHGGTSTGWHQDNHYFGTDSERVVSCGVYLEDTDRSNGCLKLMPRSHLTVSSSNTRGARARSPTGPGRRWTKPRP